MLVEADEIVVIPCRVRHGLVGVVENGFAKWITVPFETGDLARFAADAGGDVDQLGDGVISRRISSGDRTGVPGNGLDLEGTVAHYAFSSLTKKPLNSGVWAFGSVTVGVSELVRERAVLCASS